MELRGKTIIITGASSGIGAAAARLFAEEGANLVLGARSADALDAVAGEIGGRAVVLPGDVRDPGLRRRPRRARDRGLRRPRRRLQQRRHRRRDDARSPR